MNLKSYIRDIPDFPKPGINFKDITTLLKEKEAFGYAVENIFSAFKEKKITKVVSLESRGFIIGGALAFLLVDPGNPSAAVGNMIARLAQAAHRLEMDFIPLAQTLLTVVQLTSLGSPANLAACRAGA